MQGDDTRDSQERRAADELLLKHLAKNGFEGPDYDRFQNELVRYALSVLCAWLHSGHIFNLVRHSGFGVQPTEVEREELRRDGDLREELANLTVARALPRFRQTALIEGGWTYDGGAGLTSYFMGACLRAFPNEFRLYRTGEDRYRRAVSRQQAQRARHPLAPSAEEEALGILWVRQEIDKITDLRTRRAVTASALADYTHEEIRELLDACSTRVIEALLYRWRKKAKSSEGEWRHG
ncbi:hypothetical protein ACH4D3_34795 [Streptomyces sp. NPDC018026]|uniref:hypothetical protein n=1 Tax=Streptomyces sp. NPDC018026 TaxID=3365031 RepID=UPI00379481B0